MIFICDMCINLCKIICSNYNMVNKDYFDKNSSFDRTSVNFSELDMYVYSFFVHLYWVSQQSQHGFC
jgi:hypothetical protein